MEGNMFKNGLVVGIIFLFIGVSIAPGITATIHLSENTLTTISKSEELKSDLLEITVKICGTDWGKESKAKISIEDYNKLKNLYDNLKIKLHNSKTREERNSILNNVIISLDNLGILPDYISVEELKQLVTGVNHNLRFPFLFEWLKSRNQQQINVNWDCKIYGQATQIYDFKFYEVFFPVAAQLRWLIQLIFFWLPTTWIQVFKFLGFGVKIIEEGHWPEYKPAVGWVWTNGVNGVVEWQGKFFGAIKETGDLDPFSGTETYWYIGANNFKGLYITTDIFEFDSYITGNARKVHIEPYS